jgi:hypothetical protein
MFADDGRKFRSLYAELGVFSPEELEALPQTAKHLPGLALPLEVLSQARV